MSSSEQRADPALSVGVRLPQIGEVVGKYKVERVVGRGGMAVVLAARHVQLNERVALKILIIDEHHSRSNDLRTRFMQEAQIAAQLRNEHIARVVDVAALDDGTPYMVMEFVEGTELRDVLRRDKRLPVALAVEYAVQACEGLAEAHAKGIVHRDLKPPNFIITTRADGSTLLKILDFGISKLMSPDSQTPSELTETGVVMGSPKYMSPEQFGTASSADTRADVWALGTILYEMLAGVPAFDEPTLARVCARVTSGEPPPSLCAMRSDVPEALERAIFATPALEREERTQDVAQLASEILEAIDDPDAAARSEGIRAMLGPRQSGNVIASPKARPPMRPRMTSRSGGRRVVVAQAPPPPIWARTNVVGGAVVAVGVIAWLLVRPAREPAPNPPAVQAASPPAATTESAHPTPAVTAPSPPPQASATAAPAPSASAPAAPTPARAVPAHSHGRPPAAVSAPGPAASTAVAPAKPIAASPSPPPAPTASSVAPADLGTYR
jgi:serine/threonine-protein kinase